MTAKLPETVPESGLLTIRQAADYLGVSPNTLRNWAYTGRGPTRIKLSHWVRYRKDDLGAFIEQLAVTTPDTAA